MLARLVTSGLSPRGGGARLSIFIFHRVLSSPDPLRPGEPDAPSFDRLLGWIASQFRVLRLSDAVERLRRNALPSRAAAITFDDGYRDNYLLALPLLKRHGLPATVFITTAYLDGTTPFNDRVIEALRRARIGTDLSSFGASRPIDDDAERLAAVEGILERLKRVAPDERDGRVHELELACSVDAPTARIMLDWDEAKALATAGVDIGAHTCRHPILSSVTDEVALREIRESRERLAQTLGRSPDGFAYPNGRPSRDFGLQHVSMVREAGFKYAVTTAPGSASADCDPFQLPRFTPWRRDRLGFAGQSIANLRRDGVLA